MKPITQADFKVASAATKSGQRTTISKVLFTVAVLAACIGLTSPARASGIPVIDAAALSNQLVQISHAVSQITTLNNQYTNMQQQLQGITGSRGLGSLGVAGVVRNYLPDDFSNLAGQSSQLAGQIQQLMGKNAVLTDVQLSRMPAAQRELLLTLRNQVASQQATSQAAYGNASQSFNRLQSLMNAINTTNDPKSIAELQARIQAEQAMLNNEQIKLQQAAQAMQANQRLMELQKEEVRRRFAGNTTPSWKPLDQINY